jgi:hypothetical protein
MERLISYFRRTHKLIVGGKVAGRLAETVRGMGGVDGFFRLGVTGSDIAALLPKHVDVTLGELRRVLRIGRGVA